MIKEFKCSTTKISENRKKDSNVGNARQKKV
jgi:hypothetical protein